jgi:hypothetical protein
MDKILLSIDFTIKQLNFTSNLIIKKQKWNEFKEFLLINKNFVFTPYFTNFPIKFYGNEYSYQDIIDNINIINNFEYIKSFQYIYGNNYYLYFDFIGKLLNCEEFLNYQINKNDCIYDNNDILLLFNYSTKMKNYISIIKIKYDIWLNFKYFLINHNFTKNGYDDNFSLNKKFISKKLIFSNLDILENIQIIYNNERIKYIFDNIFRKKIIHDKIYVNYEINDTIIDFDKIYYIQNFLNEIMESEDYITYKKY